MAQINDEDKKIEKAERKALGARIKHVRKLAGFKSSDALGSVIGRAYQQVLKYEDGTDWPNPYILRRIAEETGAALDYLTGLDDRPPATVRLQPGPSEWLRQILQALPEQDRSEVYFAVALILEGKLASLGQEGLTAFTRFRSSVRSLRKGRPSHSAVDG